MLTYSLYAMAALYLGVLTSISPCPLATNIAAISYIGRNVEDSRAVIHAGLLYTLGRCLLYLGLAVFLAATAMSIPAVSMFLQQYMHLVLGPIFLLLGMFLVGFISVSIGGATMSEGMQKRVDAMGVWGALLLGVLFAVSFCPTSAAWFFFSLIPLAITVDSSVALPTVYGVGTALPVLVFATLIALSAQSVGKAFGVVSKIEWWARRVTGVIFVLAGIFFSLRYCFDLPI